MQSLGSAGAAGVEGVAARNGGVVFVREALGASERVTAPLTRVTGCLWHCAVTPGAQTYFKHSWGGEQ